VDKLKCYVLLVVYTPEKVEGCLQWLEKTVKNISDRLSYQIIMINTFESPGCDVVGDDGVIQIFPGNEGREFGGWSAGLDYLIKKIKPSNEDVVICANDTFCTNYGTEYLEMFKKLNVDELASCNSIYGYTDGYPEKVSVNNVEFQFWVRTNIFATNFGTVKNSNIFEVPEFSMDIFEDNGTLKKDNPLLSQRYKNYLHSWLLLDYEALPEFPQKWHSAKPLEEFDAEFLKGKILAIIREHRLTWVAIKNNINVVSLNR